MERCLEPEWLDHLPEESPAATGSRRDLVRLNAWMRNPSMVACALRRLPLAEHPRTIVDLGAGDGRFMLEVAAKLGRNWRGTHVLLLDKQPFAQERLQISFARFGWDVETRQADIFEWAQEQTEAHWDVAVANLVLHHFSSAQLRNLFDTLAKRTRHVVALEPRRSRWTLTFSRLVWVIGCNEVTRHDAPASVRAGFCGQELSKLWPAAEDWSLRESRAGLFGHLLVAWRSGSP